MPQEIIGLCPKCGFKRSCKESLSCPQCGRDFLFKCKKCGNRQSIRRNGYKCKNKFFKDKLYDCDNEGPVGEAWSIQGC